MASHLVMTPGTLVQIVPNIGCDNEIGVIVEVCLEGCCDSTAANQPWCESYKVQYEFKSCTYCMRVVAEYCRSELIEVP